MARRNRQRLPVGVRLIMFLLQNSKQLLALPTTATVP
ncbi:hypothetical protein Cflav_PD6446 [Pedosphaera parvula Ellin514]|uniref:Uncharacterized protein n=1 Tax=Pedosphaera parvula (strain Ellin514) TaxID=320771 RepID=B9XDM5_PEDPL|nr:hypothetical protein Cflav_PD6446 [Pedosphaera parvula Ellin514]